MHQQDTGIKKSPKIDPKDIKNKTPDEIEEIAEESCLIPKGSNPKETAANVQNFQGACCIEKQSG